jgi:hypothetical protein
MLDGWQRRQLGLLVVGDAPHHKPFIVSFHLSIEKINHLPNKMEIITDIDATTKGDY